MSSENDLWSISDSNAAGIGTIWMALTILVSGARVNRPTPLCVLVLADLAMR